MRTFAPCRMIARIAMIFCFAGASSSLLAYSQAPRMPHHRDCCKGQASMRRPGSHPIGMTKPHRHAVRPTTRFKPRGLARNGEQ